MKPNLMNLFVLLGLIMLTVSSCLKDNLLEPEIIIDPFTYAGKFNWREDSIKTDNKDWTKVEKGNLFSWLNQDDSFSLQKSNYFAVYQDRTNIKADFHYTIQKDSVFVLRLSSDSVYFLDANSNRRTDLKGQITFSPDTSLTLRNTALSPAISIKYKLEK